MLPTLLAAVALSAPVPKAPPIDLSWKFTKGDVFYVTHEFREEISHSAVNTPKLTRTRTETETVVYQVTVSATDDKKRVLQVKFLHGDESDSEEGDKPTAIEGLADRTTTITLDKSGRITAVEPTAKRDGGRTPADELLSESNLRIRLNTLLRAIPGESLKQAETWKADSEDSPNQSPSYVTCIRRNVSGKVGETVDGVTRLTADVSTIYTTHHGETESMRLTDESGKQTVIFDAARGRVRSVEETCALDGLLHTDLFGAEDKVRTILKQTTKITVTDEKPKAKK